MKRKQVLGYSILEMSKKEYISFIKKRTDLLQKGYWSKDISFILNRTLFKAEKELFTLNDILYIIQSGDKKSLHKMDPYSFRTIKEKKIILTNDEIKFISENITLEQLKYAWNYINFEKNIIYNRFNKKCDEMLLSTSVYRGNGENYIILSEKETLKSFLGSHFHDFDINDEYYKEHGLTANEVMRYLDIPFTSLETLPLKYKKIGSAVIYDTESFLKFVKGTYCGGNLLNSLPKKLYRRDKSIPSNYIKLLRRKNQLPYFRISEKIIRYTAQDLENAKQTSEMLRIDITSCQKKEVMIEELSAYLSISVSCAEKLDIPYTENSEGRIFQIEDIKDFLCLCYTGRNSRELPDRMYKIDELQSEFCTTFSQYKIKSAKESGLLPYYKIYHKTYRFAKEDFIKAIEKL